MRKSVDGDYLPAMRQEAIDLQLRKELAHLHRKVNHGCANFYCPDCDQPREIEGYIAADPMDV